MNKRQVIFILLLGLTLIYPLIANYFVQTYRAERAAALERYPPEIRLYIDFHPFTGTVNGFLTILFGAIIVVSWFILFLWRK